MAKKPKSTFNESFTQGMGGEMGKRTGTIVFTVIALIALALFTVFSGDDSSSKQPVQVKDASGRNGNAE